MFDKSFFIGNRDRLRKLFTGTAPIVLTANGYLQRNGDSTYPFRQDSSFWYLTGIDLPDFTLVMDKVSEYLIVPDRSEFTDISDGKLNLEKISETSGVEVILDNSEGWKKLSSKLKRSKHVVILPALPAYFEDLNFYTNPARASLSEKIKTYNPSLKFLDISPHIRKMRCIKQSMELEAIQKAIDITSSALRYIKKNIQKFKGEYEIDALLLSEFRKNDAIEAFPSVVAAGVNSFIVHYMDKNSPIRPNDLVLLDIGAEVDHYAADISRVFSVGSPTKRQSQIFQSVLDTQTYAMSLLKPGVYVREYQKQVENFIGEKLRELNLIKTIDRKTVHKFFPYGVSHFLGLDVHDVGDYGEPLEPGMVLTVEPGIHIEEEGIGIRLEDDVLITADGIKILTDNLPREIN